MLLNNLEEFQALLNKLNRNVVIVKFSSQYCPPCKLLKPELDAFVLQNKLQQTYVEIDIDQNSELCRYFKRSGFAKAVPTVLLYAKSTHEINAPDFIQVGFSPQQVKSIFCAFFTL